MDVLHVPLHGDPQIMTVDGEDGIARMFGYKAERVKLTRTLCAYISSYAWYLSAPNRKLRPVRVFGDALIGRRDGVSISQDDIKMVTEIMPALRRAYESRADQG